MDNLEKELAQQTSAERIEEMDKYGRSKAYSEINEILQGDEREGFMLVNNVLTNIDDLCDKQGDAKQLLELKDVFLGNKNPDQVDSNFTQGVLNLDQTLTRLQNSGFKPASEIRQEVINFWEADYKNFERKFKVLAQDELDHLNLEIGRSIAAQFLLFLAPNMDRQALQKLSSLYGEAVKIADNISDLQDDLAKGLINISRENLLKYNIECRMDGHSPVVLEGDLSEYAEHECTRAKKLFEEADKLLELQKIKGDNTINKKLDLFKTICRSWLNQALEKR